MKKILAECNNRLFIKANCSGIHQIILITDGLAIYLFKGSKLPYLDIYDVLKWHQKELEYGTMRKPPYRKEYLDEYRNMIEITTKAIENFKNGKLEIKND